jgi:hypothetical protein
MGIMQLHRLPFLALCLCYRLPLVHGAFTVVDDGINLSILLEDSHTDISPISALFLKETVKVSVEGVAWAGAAGSTEEDDDFVLRYITRLNGEVAAQGNVTVPQDAFALPTTISVGEISSTMSGKNLIEVQIILGKKRIDTSLEVQAFRRWASIIPLLVIVAVAIVTKKAELSLLAGIFSGACMLTGTLVEGFKSTINLYVLQAITDQSHVYM